MKSVSSSLLITFSFLMVVAVHTQAATLPDSVGTENRTDKVIVLHKVEQGQSLYSILKRYKCTLKDYMEENPTDTEKLQYDQVIRVPVSRKFSKDEDQRLSEAHDKSDKVSPGIDTKGIYTKKEKTSDSATKLPVNQADEKPKKEIIEKKESTEKPTIGSQEAVSIPAGVKTHVVGTKQTLFGLANKYGVTVEELKAWNGLPNNDLRIGTTLIVSKPPASYKPVKQIVNKIGAAKTEAPTNEVKEEKKPEKGDAHVEKVAVIQTTEGRKVTTKDETPEEIEAEKKRKAEQARKIKEDELLQKEASLKAKEKELADREAAISKKKEEPIAKKVDTAKETRKEVAVTPPKKPVEDEEAKNREKIVSATNVSYRPMKESGLAGLIDLQGQSEKLLALHRSAPIGTVIQVRNESNNRSVQVKVIGRLPDTGVNDRYVIKLSPKAFDRLNPIDKKIRAELTYSIAD